MSDWSILGLLVLGFFTGRQYQILRSWSDDIKRRVKETNE